MPAKSQPTTEIDYTKPHAFELEQGRITPVCKCGAPQLVEIHTLDGTMPVSEYGKLHNRCLAKASPDMPLFVLKPTDPSAVHVINYWYMMNMGKTPRPKMDDVLNVRKAFIDWQTAHPDQLKQPD